MKITLPSLAALLCLTPLTTQALDWPQWRGHHRDGHSQETGIAKSWPKEGPKTLWQNPDIGTGYASPVIANNHVFTLSNDGPDNEFVIALSNETGEKLWTTTIGKVGKPDQRPSYPAARSTPTLDGPNLYALSSDGDLACLEQTTGKILWSTHLPSKYNGESGTWAYSESPLVVGNLLICSPGGPTATLLALNKFTGEPAWQCPLPGADKAGYSSPIATTIDGTHQIIQIMEKSLVGIETLTGKTLWSYTRTADGSPAVILTPVTQNNLVYSAGGRVGGSLAEITRTGDTFSAQEVYFSNRLPTSTGGAVLVGDHLYGAGNQTLLCINFKTGEIAWEERSPAAPGSILAIDGHLILHGDNGQIALVKASPETYREIAVFTPPNEPDRGQAKAWAHPAVANGKLYIRDWTSLWCFDLMSK